MSIGTVVIVPGIGGCELWTPASFLGLGPPLHVWLDPLALSAFGWRMLALSADGITPAVPLSGPMQPRGPLSVYYGPLADALGWFGYRTVGASLDWRGTIARDAARLAALVEQHQGNGPVHLVGHSRGGLVIRAALQVLRDRGQLSHVGRCVGIGVPHYGSFSAVQLVSGCQDTVLLISRLINTGSAVLGVLPVVGFVRDVIVSWPAGYELFPSPDAPGLPSGQVQALYSPASWTSIRRSVSPAWLAAAVLAWRTLPQPDPAVDWLDVVGTGHSTPVQLVRDLPPLVSGDLVWSASGDGAVPTVWATQPGRPSVTLPLSHVALVQNRGVVAILDRFLSTGAP